MSQTEESRLKDRIFFLVREYYNLFHKPEQTKSFIPGTDKINYGGRVYDDKELLNLVGSSLDFWLTSGRNTARFERNLAEYLGVRFSSLVNSGSSANLLAFMSLTSPLLQGKQIERGDEVITVAAGFPTTLTPILQYGAIPVFVDVELETANIEVGQVESAFSPRTKALMISHALGNPFEIETIKGACDKHNLWLVEDNCDALGSVYKGKYTGTWGDIGTSSFYPPHHITMGEGGAVYTNNPLLNKILLSLRDWGRDCWCASGKDNTCGKRFCQKFGSLPFGYDHKYVYSHFGYNLKATDMQAAVGLAQLEKLPDFTSKRKENFEVYYNSLKVLEDFFILPKATPESNPSWFGFMLTLRDGVKFTRNQISEYLESHNIQTRNLFGGNLTRQPMFENLEEGVDYHISGDLKNTDKLANDSFWLGVYPGIAEGAICFTVEKIKDFIKKYG